MSEPGDREGSEPGRQIDAALRRWREVIATRASWLIAGVATLVMLSALMGDPATTALAHYAVPGWLLVVVVAFLPQGARLRTPALFTAMLLAVSGGAMRGGFVAPNTLTASAVVVVLGALLLSARSSWLLWLLVVMMWVGLGFGFLGGALDTPPPEAFRHDQSVPWLRAVGAFAAMTALCVLAIRYLVERMETASRERERLLEELRASAEARIAALEEQRALERRLERAERLESLGRLAGGMAHDFNNLLMVILSNATLMRRHGADPDALARSVDEMELAAKRGADLTRQLLTLGRRPTEAEADIDVGRAATDALQLLTRLLPSSIEVTTDVGEALGHIRGPRTAIEQILLNLALNARDAMPDGGRLSFDLRRIPDAASAQDTGESVRVRVRDTGSGMDQETLDQIFEPFFSTKDAQHGTGLGLSTVRTVAELCGGRVGVDSAPGQGTTFEVFLPIVSVADTTAEVSTPERATTTARVLVVEDDPEVRDIHVHALRERGHQVLEADNGQVALELIERETTPVDLVVSDAVMPGMGGGELVRTLLSRWPQLRVLVCSGYPADHFDDDEFFDGARRRFLSKPYTPDEFACAVDDMLSR